ncbi:hypothetical protein EDB81DRAFT_651990 [Dactylonectria macrodidyma]|uniref:Uncharacterized protein n=1 Tax=Dactylonectria macrodidyma TaxID=307937 RepID=A0A9P9ET56_9HYPO|nr:hypothetical protein EDB81DRAFT_651990 [Dactylonectria macrodidyma]
MSAPPCLDIDVMTPACVVWECDNGTQSLTEADPPTHDLLFEYRFDSQTASASFTIHCPVRLKGIESYTSILGLIPPSDITSFSYEVYPSPPEPVRQKLNSNLIRLRFDLSQPLRLVAPAAAIEPVQPRKRRSADVCSTLCSLARATALDIYVSDKELPSIKLKAFHQVVQQSALKPFNADISNTLVSLYRGSGGRIIDDLSLLQNNPSNQPPPYEELESPPPKAIEPTSLENPASFLPTESNDKKRRRLGESSSPDLVGSHANVAWVLVGKLHQELQMLAQRRVEQLEEENKQLGEEVDALRTGCEVVADGVQSNEAAVLGVRDDLDELTDRVEFLLQNGLDSEVEDGIVQKVTDRATANLLNKNYSLSIAES